MKPFRLGVGFGSVILIAIGLACAAAILGRLASHAAHEALEVQLDQRIAAESRSLQAAFTDGGRAALVAAIERRDQRQPTRAGMGYGERRSEGAGYLLVDENGARLAGSLRARAPAPGWEEFLEVRGPPSRRNVSQALTVQLADKSRLVVSADRGPIHEIDAAIMRMIVTALAVMIAIGLIGAWTLARLIQRRLDRLNAVAQAIIDGDHARRMPRDPRGPEFDRVSQTLNHMLDRNAELLENLRQVSTDIAHDLRTPLSRLQQSLEVALEDERDAAGYRAAIEAAARNSREILDLFAAMLRISEIESLQVRNAFKTVDLTELVERVCEAFRPDIEAAGHHLDLEAEAAVTVSGDQHLLSQMLVNLIENGIRHTPAGSTLFVRLRRTGQGVRITVADDGPGIDPSQTQFVLRRFARLEQSRSTPGHGLGLALVSAVANAHFARLVLAENQPGLIVSLIFETRPTA